MGSGWVVNPGSKMTRDNHMNHMNHVLHMTFRLLRYALYLDIAFEMVLLPRLQT